MNSEQSNDEQGRAGLEIPLERIDPAILLRMIEEFVTRQWEGADDSNSTLEQKVAQVLRQLQGGTARVVFDPATESWNIVAAKERSPAGSTDGGRFNRSAAGNCR